jgi:hypothetical protein
VRRAVTTLVVTGVVACCVAPATAQIPPGDRVVAEGETTPSGSAEIVLAFNLQADSGPAGEDPTGYARVDVIVLGAPAFHLEGRITCLSVSGNEAVVGFVVDPVLSNYPSAGGMVEMRDNGPPGSDPPDLLNAIPVDDPSVCSPLPVPLAIEVAEGDVSVIDAPPPPTGKSECRNGGWGPFGFKNQGQCVAFVERNR